MQNKLNKHWTEESTSAFAFELAAGFVRFIERSLDHLSQADIARRLNVSEGSVSQMINAPGNFTLKRIVEYARRALRAKVTILAYDDGDPENLKGPIQPEVFLECWNRCGKPKDFSEVGEQDDGPAYLMYEDFTRFQPYKVEARAETAHLQRQKFQFSSGITMVGTSSVVFGSMPNG